MAVFPADSVRTKTWGTELLTSADIHTQFDLLHAYIQAMLNSSTGHDHDGTSNNGPKLTPANLLIASQATGDLLYASSATAWARLAKGTASQFLKMKSDATIPEWGTNLWSDMPAGSVVQVVNYQTSTPANGTTAIPNDDTIPQQTEGTEFMTLAITPKSATNKLKIDVVFNGQEHGNTDNSLAIALFQDSTASAIAAIFPQEDDVGPSINVWCFTYYMTAGTTSETTFKIRAGMDSGGTVDFNQCGGGRKLGGVIYSSITITEIKV